MTVEDNTPDTGTEPDETQTPDNLEEFTYYDPDEDEPDTVESETDAGTEDGAEEPATEPSEAAPDAVVTMADGTKVAVAELIKGNQRQADYTRKSQELATARKAMEANLQRIEGIQEAFVTHLSSMIPAEPNPALALSNPNAYTAQKAQYDAALVQVQKLIEMGQAPKQIKDAMTAEQKTQLIADENARLADMFPEVSTQQGRQKFFTRAAEAAQEMGFPMSELNTVTDHRMFALAHYAKIGMEAMKSRTEAKAKAAAAPPVTPRKPGQPAQVQGTNDAMKRLARSGSIRDAVKVDWD